MDYDDGEFRFNDMSTHEGHLHPNLIGLSGFTDSDVWMTLFLHATAHNKSFLCVCVCVCVCMCVCVCLHVFVVSPLYVHFARTFSVHPLSTINFLNFERYIPYFFGIFFAYHEVISENS